MPTVESAGVGFDRRPCPAHWLRPSASGCRFSGIGGHHRRGQSHPYPVDARFRVHRDAPVNELVLHFLPPALLGEVTVTGLQGMMPMMVTAVGEVEHYALPLSANAPGAYTVAWCATRQGRDYQGSFGFTVR